MLKKVYDGSVDRLRRAERLEVMQVDRVVDICLNQNKFKTVLDCGTGSGVFAEAFQKRGLTVAGIDLNPDMITAAKKHVPKAEFKVGHLESLPYTDKSFDLVFYAHSLHEADDLSIALLEAQRVAISNVIALEWPFRFKLHGPPIRHRIRVGKLHQEVKQLGFRKFNIEKVGDQNLYILAI
ncbi:MAG: class I SAM-dependent methyltransferase [Candidatus Marinimicrobia bacterium]|nr:class I SAM-dependent methyltransferase [Candidatus Neomarinimicrobiota bacterium]